MFAQANLQGAQKNNESSSCTALLYNGIAHEIILGPVHGFGRFVPSFAMIVEPLKQQLRKCEPVKFVHDEKGSEAAYNPKNEFTSLSVLALLRPSGQYTIDPYVFMSI